jgi:hypothetical protein
MLIANAIEKRSKVCIPDKENQRCGTLGYDPNEAKLQIPINPNQYTSLIFHGGERKRTRRNRRKNRKSRKQRV